MAFLDQNYLLSNNTAAHLYHEVAAPLPIIDYHNHLSPKEIADNCIYPNLTQVWLGGDHYKWRAMRWAGVSEEFITGSADPFEKFKAWAGAVPKMLRNPLYAWTHLELRRYFDIDLLLSADTAQEVWDEANRKLAGMPVRDMLGRYNVAMIGTTDDPAEALPHHRALDLEYRAGKTNLRMAPTFRPDPAHNAVANPAAWNAWAAKLSVTTGIRVESLDSLLSALAHARLEFGLMGAKASDHGLASIPDCAPDAKLAAQAVKKVLGGDVPSRAEQDALTLEVLHATAKWNHAEGWTMQLHLNPLRNVNRRLLGLVGADAGCDVMGDFPQIRGLARFLGDLDETGHLPQAILYNLNPVDNHAFAVLAGAFQGSGENPGHVQWGSAWWFLDQEDGMRRQIDDLSSLGLLSAFVGMLTDSRSPLSFVRHEMFRRILCDAIGRDAESGRVPQDDALLGHLVSRVCFGNAQDYFGFDLHSDFKGFAS